jgi:CheY-like chemotaxis protein
VVKGQRVVVVDGLAETAQVLKAVLEPRGLQVERISRDRATGPLRLPKAPHVVVLHEDDAAGWRGYSEPWPEIPRVVIGSAEIPARPSHSGQQQYLAKPFQYRELIQAIERLLVEPENPPQP